MGFKNEVAIIGAGPAGCMCAYFASQNNKVTLFDFKPPLHTLLYTGGGRCNLAYAEYDIIELAKFYPRGEKFLYSVFSQFATGDTIDFFEKIGVKTYVQEDLRIFPISNSAKEVREKFLNALKHCSFKNEKVLSIEKTYINFAKSPHLNPPYQGGIKPDYKFLITTSNNTYTFDKIVIAIGGHAGFKLAEDFGHKIIPPKPSLTGLITEENFKPLQGVSLKNVEAEIYFGQNKFPPQYGDLLFTHEGISGPLVYKISSICARVDYNKNNPFKIKFNLVNKDLDLQNLLNSNSKKDVKNLIADFVPKSIAEYIAKSCNCIDLKCYEINGKTRDLILKKLTEFEINVTSPAKEGEIVTSGGVCLNEINSKTMQSKSTNNLYFCGEIIDVDGFCGGFNLQNCWSTGFVAGNNN